MKKSVCSNLHNTVSDFFMPYCIPSIVNENILRLFKNSISSLEIVSIYAVGSLARGNFASIYQDTKWYPFSDFDFLFIINNIDEKKLKSIYSLAEELSVIISPNNHLFHIGIKFRTIEEITALKPIYFLQWFNHGKILYGKDIRKNSTNIMTNFKPKVLDVIASRLIYICIYTPLSIHDSNSDEKTILNSYLIYNILKLSNNIMDCININEIESEYFSSTELNYINKTACLVNEFKLNPLKRKLEFSYFEALSFLDLIIKKYTNLTNTKDDHITSMYSHFYSFLNNRSDIELFYKSRKNVVENFVLNCPFEYREHYLHYKRILNYHINL